MFFVQEEETMERAGGEGGLLVLEWAVKFLRVGKAFMGTTPEVTCTNVMKHHQSLRIQDDIVIDR